MPKQTCIYALFKEYTDGSHATSAPYINGEEFPLGNGNVLNQQLQHILDVLEYFSYEHAFCFFDQANLDGLLYQTTMVGQDDYPGYDTTLLSQFKKIGLIPWTETPVEKTETFMYDGIDVTNSLFGDMSQREINRLETLAKVSDPAVNATLSPEDKGYEPCVLIHQGAVTTVDGQIASSRDGHRQVVLTAVTSISELHAWISENRYPKRRYDYNPKHGDAHHPAQWINDRHGGHRAAQLLTTEEETNFLLKYAIGRDLESELWYYDDVRGCYIYFENQGHSLPPAFHAYHLHEGEPNYENIDMEKLARLGDE